MKVLKFGGSSVGTPQRIKEVANILQKYNEDKDPFCVVFSAFSGITDQLLLAGKQATEGSDEWRKTFREINDRHQLNIQELLQSESSLKFAREQIENNLSTLYNILYGIYLLGECSPRTSDLIVSFGERNSAFLISEHLKERGLPAIFLDARDVVRTNDNFLAAKVDFEVTNTLILKRFSENPNSIHIITGFIGSTSDEVTTTLGRGGSDYTAAIFGSALDADVVEIWTDVNGVLTTDPRKVAKAFTVPKMTFAEAMEMSHFGAKVIYPPTIVPTMKKGIPLVIKNTFNPEFPGTYISNEKSDDKKIITGISSIPSVSLLTLSGSGLFGVPGSASRLFGALGKGGVNVILITQGSSEHAITWAVSPVEAFKAQNLVEAEFSREIQDLLIDPIKVEENLSILSVIGENMKNRPGVGGRLFQALGKNGINVVAIAQGSSELNVNVVIPKEDETKALNALHEAFFLSDTKSIHLFIVGTGLIGSTLFRQIGSQKEFLAKNYGLELVISGVLNTRKMLFNHKEGINPLTWDTDIINAESGNPKDFIQEMIRLNLSNSIFIDNTASQDISQFYEDILENSISISTPNKIATSSDYKSYSKLKSIADKRGVKFLYETTVGAGLPVIGTLNNLILSGDKIERIEGILSGTLSFLFNNFNENTPFSEVLKMAMEAGYTEPDPRVDLSGADVRRKITILAREAGQSLEPSDIEVQSFLPEACLKPLDINGFLLAVKDNDAYFENLRKNAEARNKRLRMLAIYQNGKAKVGLEEVGSDSPFYFLSGSDNMISFKTSRYSERPLVVRGPGAGAEVTAAGVFAEIISIANYL
jgi:bifunctional aspartokinase / homoserine dehydrogenase 1